MIPQKVSGSSTLAMLQKVREMKAQGMDVISFAAGEADFPTNPLISETCKMALDDGNTKYVSTQGLPKLREAIAQDYQKRFSSKWVQAENVLCAAGSKQAIHLILSTLTSSESPCDVLVPAPYWVSYPGICKALGANIINFKCSEENNFFPTIDELSKHHTPQTKALIFSSPTNPTGKCISQKNLQEIVQWAREKKCYLIFDEIYERLIFNEESQHFSPFSFLSEEESEYVLCVNAFSKSFSMTGWRLGYVLSHRENIQNLTALQSQVLTCLPGFVQEAAVTAIENADEFIDPVKKIFKKRMRLLIDGLNAIDGISAFEPEATFYAFANVKKIIEEFSFKDDRELQQHLLEKELLVVNPGSAFGMPGYLRFSFATDEETIQRGLKRLSQFRLSFSGN